MQARVTGALTTLANPTDPITPGDQLVQLIGECRRMPSYNLFVPREVRQALDGLAEYVAYTEGRLEALQKLCAQPKLEACRYCSTLRAPPL